MQNYLVDSGASIIVMPHLVYKRINGQPKPSTWKFIQLDRTAVKVIGEMQDALIHLSTNEKVCQYIDIVVADILDAYGLVFESRLVCKAKWIFCIILVTYVVAS